MSESFITLADGCRVSISVAPESINGRVNLIIQEFNTNDLVAKINLPLDAARLLAETIEQAVKQISSVALLSEVELEPK